MATFVAVALLSALVSSERTSPNLASELLAKESVLLQTSPLQRNAHQGTRAPRALQEKLEQSEDAQVSFLVQEAAHHAGANDVTYDRDQIQRDSESNQRTNAAQTVADGACSDEDSNCRFYASYCGSENVKAMCKKTCGLCSSGNSGSSGGSGGAGGCADVDEHCTHYTSYCSSEQVKSACKRTCGLCNSGSGGSSGSSGVSGGCVDQDENCRHYTSYCSSEQVKSACKKTCGLC